VKQFIGMVFVVLSAIGFGTLALFSHYAYADQMDTFSILFFRFLLSSIVMFCVLLFRRESLPSGATLLNLVMMGVLGYVAASFAYLTALQYASSGLVALLLNLYPVFVTLLATLILRETFTLLKGAALTIAVIGTGLTVDPSGGQLLGILLAISAAVIYSIYIIIGTQTLKTVNAIQSSTVVFASAGIASGVLMVFNGAHLPASHVGWVAIVALVLITTVLPVTAFFIGLERIGPINAAMLSTLEPVVTVILGALWLDETLKPTALAGGALILGAVLLLTRSELRRPLPNPER
jgi:drug/metabolite transporter (DMT)-like permease